MLSLLSKTPSEGMCCFCVSVRIIRLYRSMVDCIAEGYVLASEEPLYRDLVPGQHERKTAAAHESRAASAGTNNVGPQPEQIMLGWWELTMPLDFCSRRGQLHR